jgi:hypothetical protein
MGDKLDVQKGEMLKAGTVFVNPTNHPHYVWTSNEETILQVQGIGPGGIDYINPADDPRKAMATGATGAPDAARLLIRQIYAGCAVCRRSSQIS